jgi:hypothetical protein
MLTLLKQAGWNAEVVSLNCWPVLLTPRAELVKRFQHLPDADLHVSAFHVILQPLSETN